jgi:peptide deformylase
MSLKIFQAGDPVLRQRARPLSANEVKSPEIQGLIDRMREAMRAAPGVGLAAPQIGHSIQLAVIEDRSDYHKDVTPEQLADRERKPIPFQVLINPTIVSSSDEHKVFFEGCLSVAGFCALVPRSRSLRVEFIDERGIARSMAAEGWHARIVQHEVDHLQGTLYLDRMVSRSFTTLENMTQHWKGLPIQSVLDQLK